MVELTAEAKAAIRDEFNAYSRENQQLIDELNVYRWIGRLLFILLLGGSIFGLSKIQDYLDDRITNRVSKFDNLYLASVFANSSQFREGLGEIGVFLEKSVEDGKTKIEKDDEIGNLAGLSKSQRDFFFITILETLHYIDETGPDGEFVGKRYWLSLLRNKFFQRDFIESQRWKVNEKFNNRMASAYVRFADTKEDVNLARSYFENSLNSSKSTGWRQANYVGLAFISMALGDDDSAAKNVSAANTLKANYLSVEQCSDHQEYVAWARLTRKIQKKEFDEICQRVFQRVSATELAQRISTKIDEVARLDQSFKQEEFVKFAQAMFQQLIGEFWKGNRALLLLNMDAAPYVSFSDAIRYREELKQVGNVKSVIVTDAAITDVQIDGAAVSIAVKIASNQISWLEGSDGALVEGDRERPSEKLDTWTFRRNLNFPGAQWRVNWTQ